MSPQAEARRDRILEASLGVISRQGFHRTSISDIAAGAQVSRATVYQYFSDKRDLLVALADRVARRIIDAIDVWDALPAIPGDPAKGTACEMKEVLRTMIHMRIAQVLAAISANADAARLVLRLTRGNDRLVDDTLRRIDEHVVGILVRDIQVATGYGWARPCDPDILARFLLGGIEKLVIEALDRDAPFALDADALVREIGALVYNGLANREVSAPTEQPGTSHG